MISRERKRVEREAAVARNLRSGIKATFVDVSWWSNEDVYIKVSLDPRSTWKYGFSGSRWAAFDLSPTGHLKLIDKRHDLPTMRRARVTSLEAAIRKINSYLNGAGKKVRAYRIGDRMLYPHTSTAHKGEARQIASSIRPKRSWGLPRSPVRVRPSRGGGYTVWAGE